MKNLILSFSVFIILCSCAMSADDKEQGKIVVQNQSNSALYTITDVYTREETSMEWINRWHGNLSGDSTGFTELSFNMDNGRYNVKALIYYFDVPRFYETGYGIPVVVDNDSKFIIFDGNGIYDMESK